MPASTLRWDIFCAVVDNYGDVGVAWRLARQLAREHGIGVRLWVDHLASLARLAPQVDAATSTQTVLGVEVRRWDRADGEPAAAAADVVIEAFGCGLPAPYLEAMVACARQPVWINLEYLSAEPWIETCHGLASRHATLPLTRYFFFPGFSAKSGGLLRERDLFARRDRFHADARAREALWRALGLAPPAAATLVVSLFCYPNAALPALLDAWVDGEGPLLCLVPEGVGGEPLERWIASRAPPSEGPLVRGRLTLAAVPFLAQDDYDRLLWACDVNFVRGEDSFVRAQWAAQPLVWQVYPQTQDAHRLKLEAFVARYAAALEADAAAWGNFLRAWNDAGDAGATWSSFAAVRAKLRTHAEAWAAACAGETDLASALVKFCADRV
ncbi:MAG TPA: elongation factor P maturation arginine rhamnosyltransferase EarP [Casimicrobiaceae bacterium]|jgi:uncharacterized repeat protein (TIGR03837 family)|nr:elongation factor P maturation arginine rhamnosyltransferase EarP [Casimicrobiaceae bacterium]